MSWLVSSVYHWKYIHSFGCLDYQQFASENPEKLAKAIERGIPKSLRGMMWQLMYVLCARKYLVNLAHLSQGVHRGTQSLNLHIFVFWKSQVRMRRRFCVTSEGTKTSHKHYCDVNHFSSMIEPSHITSTSRTAKESARRICSTYWKPIRFMILRLAIVKGCHLLWRSYCSMWGYILHVCRLPDHDLDAWWRSVLCFSKTDAFILLTRPFPSGDAGTATTHVPSEWMIE